MKTFICVSAGKGFFPWLIRKVTKSSVNHAFLIYYSCDFGSWFSIDIKKDGPVPVPIRRALKGVKYVEVYEPEVNLCRGIRAMRSYIYEGYDYLGIIGYLLKIIVRRVLKRNIDNPMHKEGKLFCSEYVAEVINRNKGFKSVHAVFMDTASVSPKMLRHVFISNPDSYRIVSSEELEELDVTVV